MPCRRRARRSAPRARTRRPPAGARAASGPAAAAPAAATPRAATTARALTGRPAARTPRRGRARAWQPRAPPRARPRGRRARPPQVRRPRQLRQSRGCAAAGRPARPGARQLREQPPSGPRARAGDGSTGEHSGGTCPDNSGLSTGDNVCPSGLEIDLDMPRGSFAMPPLVRAPGLAGASNELDMSQEWWHVGVQLELRLGSVPVASARTHPRGPARRSATSETAGRSTPRPARRTSAPSLARRRRTRLRAAAAARLAGSTTWWAACTRWGRRRTSACWSSWSPCSGAGAAHPSC